MTLSATIITLFVSFLLSVILAPIVIPYLRKMKFGQSIREEGPESHQKKAGTPTMGGLIFITSIIVSTIGLSFYFDKLTTQSIVLLIILVGFGAIGFLDDFIKVVLKAKSWVNFDSKIDWPNYYINHCLFLIKIRSV